MKNKSLFGSILGFCLIALGSIATFISCEVGLGSAVDVESPDLNITTPPTSSVIRQAFAIAGDWSDDGSIKSLDVTLKNTGTKKEYELKDGVVTQDLETKDFKGTWNIIVDPFDQKNPLPDGSYEATITMTDNGKHKTTITRSFVIDNTPPVVVLQRPSSKAADTVTDLYGQTLSLSGQAADDNNISEIHINIYTDPSCTGEPAHRVIKKNVPPTISLDVAKFEENIENDYSAIYGSTTKAGKSEPVYCTIVAYDDAKRYPIEAVDAKDDDDLGNHSDFYYLYDEIYADVLSSFKVTELYSIMSGTFDDASRAAATKNIPETLKDFKVSAGKFQLNPANNPEFKVVGREGLKKDGSDFINPVDNTTNMANDLSNESNITVKVDVGLDAIPLNVNTLKVYLLPCNANGVPTVEDKPQNRIYPDPSDPPYEKNGTGYTFTTKIVKDACKDKDGKAVLLEIGKYYIIALEGEDSMKNEVVPESDDNGVKKTFGFRLAPNGAAPILDIQTSVNGSAYADDSMVYVPKNNPANTAELTILNFKGTVSVEDGEPKVEFSLDGKTRQELAIKATGNKGEFSFETTVEVKDFKDPDKSGQHNIVFYANQTQEATPVKKTLMYQVEAPKVTLSRAEPTAYNYYYGTDGVLVEDGKAEFDTVNGNEVTKKYLNGKNVTLPVTIIAGAVGLEEEGANKPVIEFIQGGETKLTIDAPTFGNTPAIDTTKFADGELLIRVTAYDLAGNKGVTQETYYVNQETDKPVILPKNSANSTVKGTLEQASSLANTSMNVYSANQTVGYRLIDDDGLTEVYYEIRKASSADPRLFKEETIPTLNGATDYQLDLTMPENPGTYRVTITTKDKNTTASTGTEQKTSTNQFYIRVTASAPVIESVNLQSTTVNSAATIKPVVAIRSDQLPFVLIRVVKNKTTNAIVSEYSKSYTSDGEPYTIKEVLKENLKNNYGYDTQDPINTVEITELNTESPDIEDTLSMTDIPVSGKYVISYIVIDKNDKYGESTKDITVDLNAPNITNVKVAGADYNAAKWYGSKTLALDVTAADIAGETGISAVEYSTNGTTWTALSYDNSTAVYAGSAVFNSEGASNDLYIRAKDVAGNITYFDGTTANGTQTSAKINVKIDTSAPVLKVLKYKVGDLAEKDIDAATIYVKKDVTLQINGTCADSQSGINSSTFKFGFVDNDNPDYTSFNTINLNPDGTWTKTYTVGDSETLGALTVIVENSAGVETIVSPFEVTRDDVKPELKNISLITNSTNTKVYKKSDTEYYVNNTKTFGDSNETPKFTIAGVSTDDKGVAKVTLTVASDQPKTDTRSDFTFSGLNWSDKTGSISVTLKATDIAGNDSDPVTFTVYFDTQAPAALHAVDTKNKDIYFRVGDQDNDDITPSNSLWDDDVDEDVGGKYKPGTFGNKETIKIRGNFDDKLNDEDNAPDGSGVEMIYYQLRTSVPTTIQIDGFVANPAGEATGYFAPKSATRRVFYNGTISGVTPDGTAGGKNYISFDSTYITTLSGFQEGENYLVLVAVDNVGNAAVDNISGNYYKINVDQKAPQTAKIGDVPSKRDAEVSLEFAVTDNPSDIKAGIRSVTATIDNKTETATLTNGNYKATFAVSDLPSTDGSYPISVTAIDDAGTGNTDTREVGTLIIDTKGPKIDISTPAANAKTTNTITINGTAVDQTNSTTAVGSGVDETTGLTLYYTTSSTLKADEPTAETTSTSASDHASKWVKVEYEDSNTNKLTLNGQSWAGVFPVPTSVAGSNANKTLYIRIGAQDKAGNAGYSDSRTVVVDRKAPASSVITIDGVSGKDTINSTWFKNTTLSLSGTFTDTGGSGVASVKYAVKKDGATSYAATKTIASNGTYTANVDELTAGTNTIKVWAVDTVGNSSSAVEYTVKVDNKSPEISSTYTGVLYAAETSCPVELTVTDEGGSTIDSVILSVTYKNDSNEDVTETAPCEPQDNNKFKADIKDIIPQGTVSVTATARDKAGNETSRVIANVMKDTEGPTLVINTPAANAKTSNSITVKGSASDGVGSGVKASSLKLYYTKTPSVGTVKPTADTISSWTEYNGTQPTLTGQTWEGTFDATSVADANANTTLYICVGAVDNAGNGNPGYSAPVTVVVDRKKPAKSSVKIETTDSASLTTSTTTWFNNTTVNLNGTFTDTDGSGVAAVKYKLNNGTEQTVTSTGEFSIPVKNLAAGTNTITVWAVDSLWATVASTEKDYHKSDVVTCTVKVDTEAPEIGYLANNIYTNASGNLTFDFTVKDKNGSAAVSGLKTPEVKVGTISATVAAKSGVANTYTATVAKANIPGAANTTSSFAINVTAEDNAGNTNTAKIGNLIVDRKAPTLNIASITDADTSTTVVDVNGTITISGTASDDDTLSSVAVAYKLKSGSTWETTALSNKTGTNTWSAKLNTTSLTDNTEYTIRAVAKDAAGNTTTKTTDVKVNQDSDRPIITLMQIEKNNATTLLSNEILGSISDDDGTTGLMLWFANGTSSPTAPSYSNNAWTATGWTPITVNGTSWTHTYSTTVDGQLNWWFAVGDAEHGVFVTAATENPYIKFYNQSAKENNSAAVQFKIDTIAPDIKSIQMLRRNNTTAVTASTSGWTTSINSLKFGAGYKYLWAKIVVEEKTGMDATTPVACDYLGTITVGSNCTASGPSSNQYTYIVGPIDISSKATGTPSLSFTVKDGSGKTDSDNASIKVDFVSPAIVITTPDDKDTSTTNVVDVNGKITIVGTASDENTISSVAVAYKLKSAADSAANWKTDALSNQTGTNTWSAKLDTTQLTDNTEYTIRVVATDEFGNTKTETTGVKINQDTDRPIIQMSQITGNDADVYLPSKTVFGSITDDDGIINKLWVWSTKLNSGVAPTAAPALADNGSGPSDWILFGAANSGSTFANNNWQIESKENDGSTTWYWAVADAENTIFWSKAGITTTDTTGTILSQPYVKYSGDDDNYTENAGITFKYDTESPEINSIKLIRLPTPAADDTVYKASQIEAQMGSLGVNWSDDSNIPFGADKGLMYMQVIVKERTAMPTDTSKNLLKIKLNSSDGDFLTVTREGANANIHNATTTADTTGTDPKYTYILGPFNMTNNAVNGLPAISTTSGIKTLKLVAYDDAGRSTSREKVITVDNDANIKITGVSPKPTAETSGEFTLRGSVEDAESSISAMYYHIPSTSVYNSWNTAANVAAKTAVLAAVEDAGSQDATKGWKLIDNSNGAISWRIDFTTLNKMIGYSTEGGNEATVDSNFSGYDINTSDPQFVFNLPIWIKVIDEVGNVGYVTRTSATTTPPEPAADIKVKYNPNADRPTVEIVDPEINANGIARGGTIKISGSASDNEGISAVYLQFDLNGDGNYDNETTNSENSEIFLTPNDDATKPFTAADIVPIPYTNLYGIKASGTRNWNYKFNVTGIKNWNESTNDKIVKVRAIAIDSDSSNPYVSAWSDELLIKVNNDIPSFEDLYVVQRSGTAYDGTELVRREYERNMFIKYEEGKTWFLEGKVKTTSTYLKKIMPEEYAVDASGNKTSTLKSYEWTGTGSILTGGTNNPSSPAGNAAYHDGGKTISFQIPISSGGDWHSSIYAKDDKNNENEGAATAYYEVKIDNVPPTFPDIYTAGTGAEAYQSIRLYRDSYGESLNRLDNGKAMVTNSNGARFTLAGKIEEKGSGFDKAVFYIKRIGNDEKPRVYNIMESHGKNNDANRSYILTTGTNVNDDYPIYINSDNLPVRPVTVTKVGTTGDVFSADEIETNMNIRTGGLVYIGGLYRTITAVDRTDQTVTIYPTYQGTETSALFVYGMVVDSTGENEAADGSIYESDGDGLLESYSGNQNIDYRWDATFNSANIPDGPIEIHVVTFDKAGNIGHGYMKTRASNNAPRITKVMLGTDLNGNNLFDYGTGEFKTFYLQLDEYNNPVTKTGTAGWNLDTSKSMGGTDVYWKVKKDIAVIPEFVGGAGPFYYNFSKGDAGIKEAAKLRTSATDATDISGKQLTASRKNDKIKIKKSDGNYENANWGYSRADNVGGSLTMTSAQLTASALGTNVEDSPTFYCFSFWDSTEDSTAGYDTGSCVLNIKLEQDLVDNKEPTAAINPFEWKNASGYIRTTTVTVDNKTPTVTATSIEVLGDDDVLGTVSSTVVEVDAATEVSTTTVTTTTITPNNSLYGASTANGHIELENELGSLSTHQFNNTTLGTDPKVSGKITFHGTAYDDTRLSSIWFKFDGFANPAHPVTTGDSGAPSGYTQAAWYNNGIWTNAPATMADDGWEMKVTDTSFDQTGHTVDWYLSIDTSKISNVVGLDKALSVVAMDGKSGTNNAQRPSAISTTQTTTSNKTPYYKMDVVPYITGITTRLARKNEPDPTIYSRTAQGHYPIASDEAADTNTPVVLSGFNLAANNAPVNLGNTDIKDLSSGAYAYTVGTTGISTINNLNNNDAHGSYDINTSGLAEKTKVQNMYNRQPNLTTNLNLTDDVWFDVWELKNAAVGNDGKIKEPIMRINPNNDVVGFSFSSGPAHFSMPTENNSYELWQKNYADYNGIAMAYDYQGYAHTISVGLDTAPDGNYAGRMNYTNSSFKHSVDYANNSRNQTGNITDYSNTTSGYGNFQRMTQIALDSIGGGGILDQERFSDVSIAVSANATNQIPRVYIAYCDVNTHQIRFRYGEVNDFSRVTITTTQNNQGRWNSSHTYKHFGQLNDSKKAGSNTAIADDVITQTYTNHTAFDAHTDYYSLIAGGTTGNNAGEFVSLDVKIGNSIEDDIVTVVWSDGANLYYMYRYGAKDDTDANSAGVTAVTSGDNQHGGWSKPVVIATGNNQYCKVKVDVLGGIHIAWFDRGGSDLKYAYLPTYNHLDTEGNTPYISVVDCYSQVGSYLDIDVARISAAGNVIPYISYYGDGMSSLPKYAYIPEGIDKSNPSVINGADISTNLFTGLWEITLIPTNAEVRADNINIAVWKDKDTGVKKTPTAPANADAASTESTGTIHANGTTDLVVGYATVDSATSIGYIETAMKK